MPEYLQVAVSALIKHLSAGALRKKPNRVFMQSQSPIARVTPPPEKAVARVAQLDLSTPGHMPGQTRRNRDFPDEYKIIRG